MYWLSVSSTSSLYRAKAIWLTWLLATGVGQFLTRPHLLQLQWIFAFSIGGLLFILSLAVGMPGLLGRDPFPRGQIVSEDRERAPLLADD